MSKVRKRYIILAIILLIECIPYGIIKSIIVSDHIVANKARERNTMENGHLKPQPIKYQSVDNINDKLEKQLDFLFSLGVLITLAIGNKIIKSNKLK